MFSFSIHSYAHRPEVTLCRWQDLRIQLLSNVGSWKQHRTLLGTWEEWMSGYHPSNYCAENDLLPEIIMSVAEIEVQRRGRLFTSLSVCLPVAKDCLLVRSSLSPHSLLTRLSLLDFLSPGQRVERYWQQSQHWQILLMLLRIDDNWGCVFLSFSLSSQFIYVFVVKILARSHFGYQLESGLQVIVKLRTHERLKRTLI